MTEGKQYCIWGNHRVDPRAVPVLRNLKAAGFKSGPCCAGVGPSISAAGKARGHSLWNGSPYFMIHIMPHEPEIPLQDFMKLLSPYMVTMSPSPINEFTQCWKNPDNSISTVRFQGPFDLIQLHYTLYIPGTRGLDKAWFTWPAPWNNGLVLECLEWKNIICMGIYFGTQLYDALLQNGCKKVEVREAMRVAKRRWLRIIERFTASLAEQQNRN